MTIFLDSTQDKYSVLDLGFDKSLVKGFSLSTPDDTTPELRNVVASGITPKTLIAGELFEFVDVGQAGISSEGDLSTSIRIWAGSSFDDRATAPFRVDQAGSLVASALALGGSITLSGDINISTGSIFGGQTDYNTGTGFWLGNDGGTYKFSIGDTTTSNSLTWDGSTLTVNGSVITGQPIFGDGSDGDVVISGDTSLTRDMFYDDLTIDTTKTLNPAGFRICVRGILTLSGTGKIARNGNTGGNATAAAGTTHGNGGSGASAVDSGSISGATAGVAGGNGGDGGTVNGADGANAGVAGTAGGTVNKSIGSAGISGVTGGAGGTGFYGVGGSPGSGGAAGATTTVYNLPKNIFNAYNLFDVKATGALDTFAGDLLRSSIGSGGSGGGQGGAGTSGSPRGGGGGGGGGSGSPGPIVVVCARVITGTGSIEAKGGTGGNGGNGAAATVGDGSKAVGGGGGGAGGVGGSGGVLVLVYNNKGSGVTTSVAGGAGGTGGTGGAGATGGNNGADGATGTTGTAGVLIELRN